MENQYKVCYNGLFLKIFDFCEIKIKYFVLIEFVLDEVLKVTNFLILKKC